MDFMTFRKEQDVYDRQQGPTVAIAGEVRKRPRCIVAIDKAGQAAFARRNDKRCMYNTSSIHRYSILTVIAIAVDVVTATIDWIAQARRIYVSHRWQANRGRSLLNNQPSCGQG